MVNEDVLAAVAAIREQPKATDQVWVAPAAPVPETDVNELVIFLKPEVTAPGVRLDRVLEVLTTLLAEHAVEVGGVRVVNGTFLARAELMREHYGVINTVSRLGVEALSDQAQASLRERFGDGSPDVLGGHQFLAEYPRISAYALHILFANLGNAKLAPGTYACAASMEGRPVVILNGFHPYQLERFTDPGAVLVLLAAWSTTPWRVLRNQLAGATDPRAAAAGSFRRILLERAGELGVPDVSQNYNGLHVSAGPLEGMVELRRFFAAGDGGAELPVEATCFGRLLRGTGLAPSTIAQLAGNPLLKVDTRTVSAFDLTEEVDAAAAAGALAAASIAG